MLIHTLIDAAALIDMPSRQIKFYFTDIKLAGSRLTVCAHCRWDGERGGELTTVPEDGDIGEGGGEVEGKTTMRQV